LIARFTNALMVPCAWPREPAKSIMIAALLSDENRWINGQRIEVSGGMAL
jgi:NAD(P)-dependent dehydrogenase (short-subunit alcohol dehydrogenase family)